MRWIPSLGSFSKPRRGRQQMQERHQLNKIKVQWAEQLYVRFEAWYISSPSSAEKKREIRKSYVFLRT